MKRRTWKLVLAGVVILLVAIQLIPTHHPGNPPVAGEVIVPDHVADIIETSCYDCHSHETEWPWYAGIAPIKWLVRNDVAEGREHLNFSVFSSYDAGRQAHKWEEVADEVEGGEMPLWYYLPLHREARLTEEQREALVAWARLQAEAGAAGDEAPEAAPGDGTIP